MGTSRSRHSPGFAPLSIKEDRFQAYLLVSGGLTCGEVTPVYTWLTDIHVFHPKF